MKVHDMALFSQKELRAVFDRLFEQVKDAKWSIDAHQIENSQKVHFSVQGNHRDKKGVVFYAQPLDTLPMHGDRFTLILERTYTLRDIPYCLMSHPFWKLLHEKAESRKKGAEKKKEEAVKKREEEKRLHTSTFEKLMESL